MTKIIGLTGGIGSGKSKVAAYLQSIGIPVYIADEEARKVMAGEMIVNAVKAAFGSDIVTEGTINRQKLSQIVFDEPQKLQVLNNIVHPAVRQHFKEWLLNNKEAPLVFKEAAILFETGADADCDAVITVTAPLDIRIKRVMSRDSVTKEEVEKRMASQWNDQQKIDRSDYVISNIEFEDTVAEIEKILKILRDI
ncbi:MAG TPA: dephospho-CoA kinase [Flavobacterium sp.]|jgi:dephospho-CoA kinase